MQKCLKSTSVMFVLVPCMHSVVAGSAQKAMDSYADAVNVIMTWIRTTEA